MRRNALTQGLASLSAADQRLLKSAFAAALAALTLGVVWGATTAFARAGIRCSTMRRRSSPAARPSPRPLSILATCCLPRASSAWPRGHRHHAAAGGERRARTLAGGELRLLRLGGAPDRERDCRGVPPTSLYHMFLEPDLAESVRVLGSLLSLFISVPTVTVFLVIVASLEVHARTAGARGLFAWIGMLPWSNPAMSRSASRSSTWRSAGRSPSS